MKRILLVLLMITAFVGTAIAADKVVVIPLNSSKSNGVMLDQRCPGVSVMIGIDATGKIICNDFRYVFVTSTTHSGNLGGLAGADTICQNLATSAGLPGTYLAWLSDRNDGDPATRFTKYNDYRYILTDGTTIADNWNDLIDESIYAPISIDENKNTVPSSDVWTNTNPDGTRYSQWDGSSYYYDCNNWTSTGGTGSRGSTTSTDINWTRQSSVIACFYGFRLFCFQQ